MNETPIQKSRYKDNNTLSHQGSNEDQLGSDNKSALTRDAKLLLAERELRLVRRLPRRNTFARHPIDLEHLSAIMSWRNQGITGSNNIPLGNRRRFGGDDDAGGYNPSAPAEGLSELKRGRSPERGKSSTHCVLGPHTNDYR